MRIFLWTFIFISFFFDGCNSQKIVGDWRSQTGSIVYHFDKDETGYLIEEKDLKSDFTYEIDEYQLTIIKKEDGLQTEEYYTYKIEDDELKLSQDFNNGNSITYVIYERIDQD